MKVTVSHIDPHHGTSVDEELTASHVDALVGDYEGFEAAGPMTVAVRLTRVGTKVVLRGHLDVAIRGACSRCLEAVEVPVDTDVQSVFLPPEPAHGPDAEVELSSDDAETLHYSEDEIDLEPWLRETLLLELNPYVLCQNDCAGLCPQCGVNLNHETCACTPEPADPRWAALLELKRKP